MQAFIMCVLAAACFGAAGPMEYRMPAEPPVPASGLTDAEFRERAADALAEVIEPDAATVAAWHELPVLAMVFDAVDSDSPLGAAGVEVGDCVLELAGLPAADGRAFDPAKERAEAMLDAGEVPRA